MLKYGANNIGKIFLGSNEIGKAFLGSNLVFKKDGGGDQPEHDVGFIRNSGKGAYVDTGIVPNQSTRMIVRARGITPGADSLFGCRTAAGSNGFSLVAPAGYDSPGFRFDYANAQIHTSEAWPYFFFEHEYDLNGNTLSVDGVQLASGTASTFTPGVNIVLFASNSGDTITAGSHPFEISQVRIYQSGVLVRDMVATSSAVFYDNVSGQTFGNAGGGELTYIASHPDDALCTPLEYIVSDNPPVGFESGVYGSKALAITSCFYLTPDVKKWQSYLGTRPSSGYDFELSFGTTSYANARAYHRINGSTSTTSPNTNTNNYLSSKLLIYYKRDNASRIYQHNVTSARGTASQTTSDSYQSRTTLGIGVLKSGSTPVSSITSESQGFNGRIYSLSMGYERCYAPVLYGGKAGLYDLLTDTFYASETANDFVAGPTIQ